MERTGSREFIGAWDEDGEVGAETSFWCGDMDTAKAYMYLFNQNSILDWAAKARGEDWEKYYIRNDRQKNEEIDYDGIIKKIL
jgi:hypothetical protein